MHKLFILLLVAGMAAQIFGQQSGALATSTVRSFTSADLSSEVRDAWEQRDRSYANAREQLLSQMVADIVLELEARSRNTTTARLIADQKKKVADPSDEQINAVYQANLQALENKPLSEVRPTIVQFLRRDPEDRILKGYVDELAAKFRTEYKADVNAAVLRPADVLFTVGGRGYTVQEFESRYRLTLYDVRADLFDDVLGDLESAVFDALVSAEAASLKIEQQAFLAREVTDKMKQFSDEERAGLITALKQRLFLKYKVRLLIAPPVPPVQKISVDDDPSRGPITATVTVVMFADFQCSVCARVHPILQSVIAEFPEKVRFVERDFPIESLHENAFNAARAAGAANTQGKFFEYADLLYRNQSALDDQSLKKYAAQIGLNARQFELDFNAEKTAAEVRKDIADGESYGVSGTPTVFVNGVKVRRLSAEYFREAIRAALRVPTRTPARSPRRN